MRWNLKRYALLIGLAAAAGCAGKRGPAPQPVASTQSMVVPPSEPVVIVPSPTPVATANLGTGSVGADLKPKPKPFIALPKALTPAGGRPSTLLLEHASPDSPVPLSEYPNQPAYTVQDMGLRTNLSEKDLQLRLGKPAQIADTVDPWLVYRLVGNREIWLHFSGQAMDHLDAADVVRGAEDGYVRDRVFSADDPK